MRDQLPPPPSSPPPPPPHATLLNLSFYILHFQFTFLLASEYSETGDSDDLTINLMDLQDDVIDSPSSSPCSPYQLCSKNSRFHTRQMYDYSADEEALQRKALLKSILKRSKSDDTEYDSVKVSTNRTRAMTMSDDLLFSSQDDVFKRRRYKSVTFSEEPIVFEFDKLSKRQWKKKVKLDKQRETNQTKPNDLVCSAPVFFPANENKKQSKKFKKAEKLRARNNSESRSEEEIEAEGIHRKIKKKKKSKIKNLHIENIRSNPKTEKKETSLDNQLIFDLE